MPPTITRRATLAAIGVYGLSGVAGARRGRVPEKPTQCAVVVPDDEPTVQAGVDAADPGETVCVRANDEPYAEQVRINKDLTLEGIDGPTITAPSSLQSYTIPESGPQSTPIVFAYGGTAHEGTVSGTDTVDVTIEGIEVDGGGNDDDASRLTGILARNVRGDVADNAVENMGVGGPETFGILAYGDSNLSIRNNDVRAYERGGIGVLGNGGTHLSPHAEVRNNSVTGSTGIGTSLGPNGIQIAYGASGIVSDNDVRDNRYADEAYTAAGILVFESDGVQVKRNTVTNSDVGIAAGSWGWFRPSADDTQIVQNDVQEANAGVLLRAVAFDGFSRDDPSVSNCKVVNNAIDDPDPDDEDAGVAVQGFDLHPDYDPTVDNNKVIRNRITGFAEDVVEGGTRTKIHAIEP